MKVISSRYGGKVGQMKFHWYAALAAVFAVPNVLFAADDTIESLKKQIQELDQKVRILERKAELETEAGAIKSKDSTRLTAGASGFSFSSADSNFVLRLRGYVQADARFYMNDHIPVNDTFLLRRVRPIFEGTVFQNYDYKVMLDFATGINSSAANNAFLQEAYVNAHYWPGLQIQVGKFKEPVGLERLQLAPNLLFVERGFPTQLVPNRDVGVQLHGQLLDGLFNYAAGVFNGVQDGGSGDNDAADDHKDVAGRLFAHPFRKSRIAPLQGLGVGVGASLGNQAGSLPSYKTPGQQTFFSYPTGVGTNASTANVTADGEHWRLAPQAYYYWGPFGIFGEYVISSQKLRRDAGTPLFGTAHNHAWQIAASWFVTGERNSFAPVSPIYPFNLPERHWGALELAARYGELKFNDELFAVASPGGSPLFASSSSARKARSWGAGANWYLNKNIKLSLDYDQTAFEGGSSKPGAVTAEDERVIMSRVQFSF